MTEREIMDLAEVICDAGCDWNGYIENCHEKEERPYLLYDEFLAQYILESGYRKEREERSKEGKSLREKIERYKIESGFASATPEERAMFAESLIDILKSLDIPTIDTVPVVRCANCFYAFKVDAREPMYDCSHLCREGCTQWVASDDFCSYGERRTDDA